MLGVREVIVVASRTPPRKRGVVQMGGWAEKRAGDVDGGYEASRRGKEAGIRCSRW